MIVRPGQIRRSETPAADVPRLGRAETLHLSDAGGLTQFGVHRQTLHPGASTGARHWHSAEDEFLFVLDGCVTLRDDQGAQDLGPDDAVCWPQGRANGHCLMNHSTTPCRYLIVGSRAQGDVCTYPDEGRRQINEARTWRIEAADGSVVKSGDLPPELLGLRAPWGRPFDGLDRPQVIRAGSVPGTSDPGSAAGLFGGLGDYVAWPLSDAGGLTQFGAFTETLMPGGRSSHRHWHAEEDEFLYTLDGVVTLHEDGGPQDLPPGSCVCWPAGVANGHCLENRTNGPVRYLVVGTRLPEDEVTYPDIDLHCTRRGGRRTLSHKDGTPYPGWPREDQR